MLGPCAVPEPCPCSPPHRPARDPPTATLRPAEMQAALRAAWLAAAAAAEPPPAP